MGDGENKDEGQQQKVQLILQHINAFSMQRRYNKIKMSMRLAGEEKEERKGRKQSYSSITCDSDSPLQNQLFNQLITPPPYEFRPELFTGQTLSNSISQKMNQKAVSWLATVCWSKDLSQECFWQAVLLFYCLKSKKKVQKQNLQLVLTTCLNLSIKMDSGKGVPLKEVGSCSPSDSLQKIRQMQAVILEQLNYNLFIPHYLNELLFSNLPPEQIHPLLFLCELLTLKHYSIFFDKNKIQKIAEMLGKNQLCKLPDQKEICEEIIQIMKWKQAKIITNKYSPKFNMQDLLKKITP